MVTHLNVAISGMCHVAMVFNIFIAGMVREIDARRLETSLNFMNVVDREWNLNLLLFANDTAVVANSEEELC